MSAAVTIAHLLIRMFRSRGFQTCFASVPLLGAAPALVAAASAVLKRPCVREMVHNCSSSSHLTLFAVACV